MKTFKFLRSAEWWCRLGAFLVAIIAGDTIGTINTWGDVALGFAAIIIFDALLDLGKKYG